MGKKKKIRMNLFVRIAMIVMAMVIAIAVGMTVIVTMSDGQTGTETEAQITSEEIQKAAQNETDEDDLTQTVQLDETITAEGSGKRLWDQIENERNTQDDEESETAQEWPTADYVLPDSGTREIQESDLEGLSATELRVARNEILARHGRIFGTGELQAYFESKSWYQPTVDAEEFDAHVDEYLSDVEERNIEFILSHEQ